MKRTATDLRAHLYQVLDHVAMTGETVHVMRGDVELYIARKEPLFLRADETKDVSGPDRRGSRRARAYGVAMGRGAGFVNVHLDTHIALWSAAGDKRRLKPVASRLRRSALYIYSITVVEMEVLHEIGRVRAP